METLPNVIIRKIIEYAGDLEDHDVLEMRLDQLNNYVRRDTSAQEFCPLSVSSLIDIARNIRDENGYGVFRQGNFSFVFAVQAYLRDWLGEQSLEWGDHIKRARTQELSVDVGHYFYYRERARRDPNLLRKAFCWKDPYF